MSVERLPRGTRKNPRRVAWLIAERKKMAFERMAKTADVSTSVFLERVIDHLEEDLTDRGLPSWWPTPEPKDGELPIDAA